MKQRTYLDSMHLAGRIWTVIALGVLIGVPVIFCIANGVWPRPAYVAEGLGRIALIFYPTGIIEVIAFSPLLGVGGTYLAFVSGNITNLKLPCALAAMESADARPGSEEGEVLSTISIAASTIVTTLVIALFVATVAILMRIFNITDTSQIKTSISTLAPALDNALPALFGALGASYFSKYFTLSIAPIAVVVIVLLYNGAIGSGTLVPVGVVAGLLSTQLLYKAGKLK